MTLYSIILLCSIIVPFALSFDKKLQFYKQLKFLIPSTIFIALFYIAVDVYFSKIGVWGFNPRYHSSIVLLHLPLEEWLFFIVIPYASIFLHDSISLYFTCFQLRESLSKKLTILLIILSLAVVLFNLDKLYTTYIFTLLLLVLLLSFFEKTKIINRYYLTFLVVLIPFVMVNALLTGSFLDEPVVWYTNSETLGMRFLTIPVEDFGYAFSLILFNLFLREKLKSKFSKSIKNLIEG